MEKFTLVIEETVAQKFEVIADDAEKAMEIALDKYREGEFVLEHSEVHHKQIAVMNPEGEATEWIEF